MDFVITLWQPILLASVLVFFASAIIWMATPLHKNDFKGTGDKEAGLLSAIKSANLNPGVYFVPFCHGNNADKEQVAAKLKTGPWAQIIILPKWANFGQVLGLWFVHLLIVNVVVAYLLSHTGLTPTTPYLHIFRLAGAISLLAYAGYAMPMCLWHSIPWRQLPGRIFDGIVYSLLTAGTFAWLIPHA